MSTLNLAVKASQSHLIPPLLVATLVNKSTAKPTVAISFEDVETLKSGDQNVAAEFTVGDEPSTFGGAGLVKNIAEAYPFLRGKLEANVGLSTPSNR